MSRTRNIPELQPLSVVLQPSFRLRAPKRRDWRDLENGHMKSMAGAQQATLSSSEGISFIFRRGASRQAEVTLPNGRNVNIPHGMQDILMYAPALSMLEGYRLYISPRDVLDAEPYPGSHSSTSRDADPSTRGRWSSQAVAKGCFGYASRTSHSHRRGRHFQVAITASVHSASAATDEGKPRSTGYERGAD